MTRVTLREFVDNKFYESFQDSWDNTLFGAQVRGHLRKGVVALDFGASESVDVVYSCNVLEHLEHPEVAFHEIHRILRLGGVFLFKTPNKYHYVAIIASVTPHRFHEIVNLRRGRPEGDTFPTHYRANSASQIRRLAGGAGFSKVDVDSVEGRPEYLRPFGLAYFLGLAYERLVNSGSVFSSIRCVLCGTLTK